MNIIFEIPSAVLIPFGIFLLITAWGWVGILLHKALEKGVRRRAFATGHVPSWPDTVCYIVAGPMGWTIGTLQWLRKATNKNTEAS